MKIYLVEDEAGYFEPIELRIYQFNPDLTHPIHTTYLNEQAQSTEASNISCIANRTEDLLKMPGY